MSTITKSACQSHSLASCRRAAAAVGAAAHGSPAPCLSCWQAAGGSGQRAAPARAAAAAARVAAAAAAATAASAASTETVRLSGRRHARQTSPTLRCALLLGALLLLLLLLLLRQCWLAQR